MATLVSRRGASRSVASVTMPSVPSAPMNLQIDPESQMGVRFKRKPDVQLSRVKTGRALASSTPCFDNFAIGQNDGLIAWPGNLATSNA